MYKITCKIVRTADGWASVIRCSCGNEFELFPPANYLRVRCTKCGACAVIHVDEGPCGIPVLTLTRK